MSAIVVERRHGLPLARARRLAEAMAQRLQGEYGGSYAWDGNALRFERAGASGQVMVTGRDVAVRVEISLFLAPLRSLIEREIRAFCDEHLGQAGPADAGQPAARRRRPTKSSRSQGKSRSVRPK